MALQNTGNEGAKKVYFIKPVSRDANKKDLPPHFELTAKVGDKYEKQEATFDTLSGNLKKIEHRQRTFDKIVTDEVVLVLEDPIEKEVYRLDLRLKLATRSLLNSIMSLKSFDNISIKYYRSKNGYDSFWVTQNGEKVEWKYSLDEIPKPTKVKVRGVETSDFFEVDQWYVGKIMEFAAQLEGGGVPSVAPTARSSASSPSESEAVVADSEIPF